MKQFGIALGEIFSPNSKLNKDGYGVPLITGVMNVAPLAMISIIAISRISG